MNKMMKIGVAALTVAMVSPAFSQDNVAPAAEEWEGAIGWTPFVFGLASPVQLPWGHCQWDIFGLGINCFYTGAPKIGGLSVAGLATYTKDEVYGVVVSGLGNIASEDVYGLRATLGMNGCYKTLYGLDCGAFGMHDEIWGGDIEFVATLTRDMHGFLCSLVGNITEEQTYGLALAGGVNLVKVAYGMQLAGVFNMADELHGCQLSLVNYARTCPWGFQIGLINIIMDNQWKFLPIVNGYF